MFIFFITFFYDYLKGNEVFHLRAHKLVQEQYE